MAWDELKIFHSQKIHVWLLVWLEPSKPMGVMQSTKLTTEALPKLFHVQTKTYIELPKKLSVIHIGKPNNRIPPDIDVSNFPKTNVVSRIHANILVEGSNYFIEDIGSANGTYLNHTLIRSLTPYPLNIGDRIDLGKKNQVTFLFQLSTNSPATESKSKKDVQVLVALFSKLLGVGVMFTGLGFLSSIIMIGGQPEQTLSQEIGKTTTQYTAASAQAERENYKAIALEKIAPANALIGNDPKAIALSVFGKTESEGGSRDVRINYPRPNQAVVIITQTGVADDSVRSIRYRTEFRTTSKRSSTRKQWKMVWAGSQMKCQPGRGHQDWSTELCL
jgi:pSer/pThr/pTyr-binding forkhead associated (FHA) protein